MQKWLLYIGANKDVTLNERSNLTGESNSNIIELDEEKAFKEACRRIKKMRYYLVGQNVKRVIAFDMFPKRHGLRSLVKLGYNVARYPLYVALCWVHRKTRKEL